MNIKDMVKDGKRVAFRRIENDNLIYATEDGFEFRVPVEDTGDGVFLSDDKAIIFMRYIRKEIANVKEKVKFVRFRKSEAFYITEDGFEFPVPIKEITGPILAVDNKVNFEKFIQSHLDSIEEEMSKNKASQ